MESVNEVKEALSARSRTATLEELASQGRKQVRLIKAEHVAAMIRAAVHSAIDQSGLIPRDEADNLVEKSREEFKAFLEERQLTMRRIKELEEQLAEREAELEQARAGGGAVGAVAGQPGAGGAAGGVPVTAGGIDVSAALEKLAGSLNERLEKLGRKMGISSAVEGAEVNLEGLFKRDDKDLESNIENIQVKKKAGGGIAANLERLKKLKGGG